MDKDFFIKTDDFNRSNQVVKSVISMAKNLNIKVVAEGVETQEQIDFLISIDCDIVQGFYFAKPMPISDYVQLI
ncbi:MAG: EAL domain-containing protein, partial [Eubacterium sp.]